MSRSLSTSRPDPRWRYPDTPPPYTPRSLSPEPHTDPEPPHYPEYTPPPGPLEEYAPPPGPLEENNPPPGTLEEHTPSSGPLEEHTPPPKHQKARDKEVKSDVVCHKLKYDESHFDFDSREDFQSNDIKKKYSNKDSRIHYDQNIFNIKDQEDDDLEEKILSNQPRNPPIISEVEEELKPGNRRKNVCHDNRCTLFSQNYLAHTIR